MNERRRSKECGILLPVFSLPSDYGIGSFGGAAYRFIDFLAETGHKYWQVLPLNPTSFGDSPYQSPSAFAGNPYFIDLDLLCAEGLLTVEECRSEKTVDRRIDYACLYRRRISVLRKAFARFVPSGDYRNFVLENQDWLWAYGKFMALKEANHNGVWNEWSVSSVDEKEARFWYFVQFEFFRQWRWLKQYANKRGIKIIGDMPIYVAYDSADVRYNKELFELDEKGAPLAVAGVPPDAFSSSGQLWGNPLYRWDKMKEDGYTWWRKRIRHALNMYDCVRIDHFIGFIRYYSIPYGDRDALGGRWREGPGTAMFQGFGSGRIVAEDLGIVTDEVRSAIGKTGFAGMKILQHAFGGDPDCEHKPSNFKSENILLYTGTHDNETLYQKISGTRGDAKKTLIADLKRECAAERIRASTFSDRRICDSIRRLLYRSKADIVIIPMQDVMNTGESGRINSPSTVGGNWTWRLTKKYFRYRKRLLRLSRMRDGGG